VALRQQAKRAGEESPSVRGADWRLATVAAVGVDGTVTADGITARRMETYRNAAIGDVAVLTQSSMGNWIAHGRMATGAEVEPVDYTPTVAGGGSVAWTSRTGWYYKVGKMVYVCIYLGVSANGSGTGFVSVDMPTAVYRGTRQMLSMHTESIGPNGSHVGNGSCVFFTSGTGATADRLRTSSNDATNRDSNITGVDLLAAGTITIEGWYREA
jgi:hypothetical protein